MDEAFKAMVEPRRRAILQLVQIDELSAGDIALQFDVSRPAISQHLSVLLEAGLIDMRREGTKRLYRANMTQIRQLRAFWDEYWDISLLRLKLEAEKRHRQNQKKKKRGSKPG